MKASNAGYWVTICALLFVGAVAMCLWLARPVVVIESDAPRSLAIDCSYYKTAANCEEAKRQDRLHVFGSQKRQ